MPSRSRHNRNHSSRSSNKNRNRRSSDHNNQNNNHNNNSNNNSKQDHDNNNNKKQSSSNQTQIIHTTTNNTKNKTNNQSNNNTLPTTSENTNNTNNNNNKMSKNSIQEFQEEILSEFNNNDLSINELSNLLEKYVYRRNANALFLFELICHWISSSNNNNSLQSQYYDEHDTNLLNYCESSDKIRNTLFKVLFGLTDKITFKNIINQNAWSLSIIKILSCGLPTLSSALMHRMAKHVKANNINSNGSENNFLQRDQLRFIIMFLRPEIIEQCAELVQYNPSIFEEEFRELIDALCDNYQPFRTWLFARLCSNKRKLIEPQLSQFICFGNKFGQKTLTDNDDEKVNVIKESVNKNENKYKRSKELIINEAIPSFDDDDNKHNEDNNLGQNGRNGKGLNLNRLMNAFKFCMRASNQLVINNQSRNYYELGMSLGFFSIFISIILALKIQKY